MNFTINFIYVNIHTHTMNNNKKQYKIVLIGDGGCGKSTYINRLLSGEFEKRYLATLGCSVASINIDQNTEFSIWDTAGQEKFGGLRDGYYLQADLAIIFYDVSSKITYENIEHWHNNFKKVCPNSPCIIVATKLDIKEKKIDKDEHVLLKKYTSYLCGISSLTNNNLNKPFELAKKIFNL